MDEGKTFLAVHMDK